MNIDFETAFYPESEIIFYFCLWFGYANSCINPVLYYWRNSEIRRGMQHLITGKFGRKNVKFNFSSISRKTVSVNPANTTSTCQGISIMIAVKKKCRHPVKDTEAAVSRCSTKQVFLNISQNSVENICDGISFSIRLQASGTSAIEPSGGCFCRYTIKKLINIMQNIFLNK